MGQRGGACWQQRVSDAIRKLHTVTLRVKELREICQVHGLKISAFCQIFSNHR